MRDGIIRFLSEASEVVDIISQRSKIISAHGGVFFGIANVAAAAGSGLGQSGSDADKDFWNYFSFVMSTMAVVSTFAVPFCRSPQPHGLTEASHLVVNDSEEGDDLTGEEENVEPVFELTLYEKLLFALAAMGTVVGALNIARFNPDFLPRVRRDDVSEGIYISASGLISAFGILAGPIQEKFEIDSALLSAFNETCGKAGVWVGAIFSLFLTQFVVFEQKQIDAAEASALSATMATLFFVDLLLFYGAIQKTGSLKQAKKFIELPLAFNADRLDKFLWWPNFVLDVMRAFVSVVANVMSVPNMLSLSDLFNKATDGKIKADVYATLCTLSLCAGANNAGRLMLKRLGERPTEYVALGQA